MNVAAKIKQSTDLAVIETMSASVVFVPGGVDAILQKIEAEVRSIKTDISTPAGRQAVGSLAYKVARSKTALDDMGKELVSELKAKTGAIDAERRTIRDRLDALKDEVRKPLTDWESAEEQRVTDHENALEEIAETALNIPDSSEEIQLRINRLVVASAPHFRDWQEFKKRADETIAASHATLARALSAAEMREAERAELQRLRQEQAERAQRERDERIAAEAAERARAESEAKAKREAEQAAERAAAEQRRLDQERAAAEARAAKAEQDRIAAERKATEDAKAAAEAAEQRRVRAVEDERARVAAIQAQEAAETARREANKKHKAKINNEVLGALVLAGVPEDASKLAITAIAQGAVPHTRISY